jgi:hypothetical protein
VPDDRVLAVLPGVMHGHRRRLAHHHHLPKHFLSKLTDCAQFSCVCGCLDGIVSTSIGLRDRFEHHARFVEYPFLGIYPKLETLSKT